MRSLIFCGILVVLASVSAEFVKPQKYYFEEVGVPLARKIKEYEDSLFNKVNDGTSDPRIVGGVVAPLNAHPYLGGLVISFTVWPFTAACGSTLVSRTKLITAAHCWFDGARQAFQLEVVLGSQFLFNGGTRIVSNNVVMHPQWTPQWLWNDIAVISLPWAVTFTNAIQPIALPLSSDWSQTFDFQFAVAAGYGRTSDMEQGVSINAVVSHVNLMVLPVSQCQATFGAVFVQPSNICTSGTGGVGLCGGDSGGPLVFNRNGVPTLIGVSSFVADLGCQLGFPSAYARVTSFMNFINQNL